MSTELPGQPSWSIEFEPGAVPAGPPPSRFVEVTVTLRLEVTDPDALRAAAGGASTDLASCAGLLVRSSRLLGDIPGVTPVGSSASAGYWNSRR